MASWNYQRQEQQFEAIPEGPHRIRIKSAEKTTSSNGKDMIALQFDVSGYPSTLYHYIVFLEDRPEITNRNLTQFFDSFPGIQEGNFNVSSWVGKTGACIVKHEEYNGKTSAKVKYFIDASKQDSLPPWKGDPATNKNNGFLESPSVEEELPFDF